MLELAVLKNEYEEAMNHLAKGGRDHPRNLGTRNDREQSADDRAVAQGARG